jgi:putative transposase
MNTKDRTIISFDYAIKTVLRDKAHFGILAGFLITPEYTCNLSRRLSMALDAAFCVDALEEALGRYGPPEIFNTDQESQFTSAEFTSALEKRGVKISMDGRGRALDNVFVERLWRTVKYEDVYLNDYETVPECRAGLAAFFERYNSRREHQSLGYRYPQEVYLEGTALPEAA